MHIDTRIVYVDMHLMCVWICALCVCMGLMCVYADMLLICMYTDVDMCGVLYLYRVCIGIVSSYNVHHECVSYGINV